MQARPASLSPCAQYCAARRPAASACLALVTQRASWGAGQQRATWRCFSSIGLCSCGQRGLGTVLARVMPLPCFLPGRLACCGWCAVARARAECSALALGGAL